MPVEPADADSAYAAELAAAAERSGCDESIITGEGRIRGRRVAIIAGEFRFLAGSIGAVAAERIVLAFERATREELPVFAAPSSGGTRMQEGTPAFVGMVKISAACAQLKAAGLPYLVYLRHPTTGGVFASWGSLGQVTVAEPGAMIGFLGARVYEALYGQAFPEGVQTAENLFEHGLIDAILPVEALAETADRALNVLMGPREDLPDVPELVTRSPAPTSPPGTRSCARGATTAPVSGRCSSSGRRTCSRCTARARASTTPGCSWRSPGSAAHRASCWARTAAARRSMPPCRRRDFASPVAAWRWRASSACRS